MVQTGAVSGGVYVNAIASSNAASRASVAVTNVSTGQAYAVVLPANAIDSGNYIYEIPDVPAGIYRAIIYPDPRGENGPFAMASYGTPRRLVSGSPTFTVRGGVTTTGIDFDVSPAGFLRVRVLDRPLSGSYVTVQDSLGEVAVMPSAVLINSEAYFANVPLSYKINVSGPQGYPTRWFPRAQTLAAARVITEFGPGFNRSITFAPWRS